MIDTRAVSDITWLTSRVRDLQAKFPGSVTDTSNWILRNTSCWERAFSRPNFGNTLPEEIVLKILKLEEMQGVS